MEKNKEIKKAMVLSSGGVDSTTCLGMAVEKYGKDQVLALSISYGQKHQKEIEAALIKARSQDELTGLYNKESGI